MLGPSPYKKPQPVSIDASPSIPTVDGVPVPSNLKILNSELISLAEAPEVSVPSTYDDALRNDELLENIELIDEKNLEVFPSGATKEEIAFGVAVPEKTDSNAFGGLVGKVPTPTVDKVEKPSTEPLTPEEKTVVIQNTAIVANIPPAGMTAESRSIYELGTKLVGVPEAEAKLQGILTTTVNLTDPDTEIIEVQEFDVPPSSETIDGGEF